MKPLFRACRWWPITAMLLLLLGPMPRMAAADVISSAGACIEGAIESSLDPKDIERKLKFLKEHGGCIQYFYPKHPNSKTFYSMLGILVAARAADKFDDMASCKAYRAKAIVEVCGAIQSLVGKDVCQLPADFENDPSKADQYIENTLKYIPEVATYLEIYECACAVTIDLEGDYQQMMEIFEACGGLLEEIEEIVDSIISGLEDGIDAVGDWLEGAACDVWEDAAEFFGADCDPPPPKDINCQGIYCALGQQCGGALHNSCVPCSDVGYSAVSQSGLCACQGNLEANYQPTAGGPVLIECRCPAPLSIITGPFGSDPHCACPGGKVVIDGECRCPPGEILLSNGACGCEQGKVLAGQQCVVPCADPDQVTLSDGSCCNRNQVTSCGLCCPEGQQPDPHGGSCMPREKGILPLQVTPGTLPPASGTPPSGRGRP